VTCRGELKPNGELPDELSTELVDHLFRRQAGRMVSTLTRVFGPRHMGLAEDVVQDALVKALEQWPHRGVPENPAAWLIEVARHRALDVLRRRSVLAAKVEELARAFSSTRSSAHSSVGSATHQAAEAMDDQLAMMFLCCHPRVPRDARLALTLKTVCGFGTGEIARAFLIQKTAAAQRIVRAKRSIREHNLSFSLPEAGQLAERLDSVLQTLYLMFNEGYSSAGEQLLRQDLCEESIRLAGLVADHSATTAPHCHALLALFLLQSARSAARVDPAGDLFLLCDQDRSQWDRGRISEGLRRLEKSASGDRMTEYHLEAGIAAAHATASDFAATDWVYIAHLYDQLYAMNPSPVVALNRAVAIARSQGVPAGLRAVAAVAGHPALARYHLLPATLGMLWREAGDPEKAASYFQRAMECECSAPERRFLERQLGLREFRE
jgi:RNA polymerase sigma-70 factor (ECF subfamily)